MSSTLTNLLYHIVFSTKDRQPLITGFKGELYKYVCGIIEGEGGKVLSINGSYDHIHIAAKLLPRLAISNMLQLIKGHSSRWINENRLSFTRFSWQRGYGAFTLNKSQLRSVIKYIGRQEEHHHVETFKEEYIALLVQHEIEYDERYLWD